MSISSSLIQFSRTLQVFPEINTLLVKLLKASVFYLDEVFQFILAFPVEEVEVVVVEVSIQNLDIILIGIRPDIASGQGNKSHTGKW